MTPPDTSAAVVADLQRQVEELTRQRDTMHDALLDIDRRIREETGAIRVLLNQYATPEVTREWKWAIYGSAIHAQLAAGARPKTEPVT